jgi:sortase A
MRVIGGIGRVLVTIGLLTLSFAAYQLWGTGLYEARAQDSLKQDFATGLKTTTTTNGDPSAPESKPLPIPSGDAIAIISIPSIGVEHAVVQGVRRADLRKGPGHYPNTPLPGELGNAAIAGHRTTYGAPFGRLDELRPGNLIQIRTATGEYRYSVTETIIVRPTELSVLDATPTATLTLTTCHPRFSASRRLVVHAKLVPASSAPIRDPSLAQPASPTSSLDAAHGKVDYRGAVIWGVATLIVGLGWWGAFRKRRIWQVRFGGFIPFAIVCFIWFGYVDRALPGNY